MSSKAEITKNLFREILEATFLVIILRIESEQRCAKEVYVHGAFQSLRIHINLFVKLSFEPYSNIVSLSVIKPTNTVRFDMENSFQILRDVLL